MRRVLVLLLCFAIAGLIHGSVAAAFVATAALVDDATRLALTGSIDTGPQITQVFDRHDRPIFSFFTEQRTDTTLDRVSPHVISAVLAAEDHRFYSHRGVDPVRIAGAVLANLRAGRISEGGSTITQQLVRSTALDRGRTFTRKVRELLLALDAEARYSKWALLEAYLNRIYFGDGYYGIEAASRGYFGRSALDLEPAEAALLAGIIKSPSKLTPRRAPQRAKHRRDRVLAAMRTHGWLTERQWLDAVGAPLDVLARREPDQHVHARDLPRTVCALYFKEELRRVLVSMFGEDRVHRGGLRVYATIDPLLQVAAEETIATHLAALDRRGERPGSRPRVVGAVGWGRQEQLQGSLVSLDPRTGEVLALVGGRDFHASGFNRATQARRQPGSAFKPLVFAAALERGYSPATVLAELDNPISGYEGRWLPDGQHEAASYTLRRALQVSSNRAAAQLLQRIGTSSAIDLSRRLGITSDLPPVPSLALGAGEVTLMELTAAYGAFANGGVVVEPVLIRRVDDRDGRAIWHNPGNARRALSDSTAFLMTHMLAGVVDRGTAYTARVAGFRLPAAGKTGTSTNYADAWFVGYTARVLTGVWFGHDTPRRIIENGYANVVAVPAWAHFMRRATSGHPSIWFTPPSNVERVAVCRLSGDRATPACYRPEGVTVQELADDGSIVRKPVPGGAVSEDYFARGSAPWATCYLHVVHAPLVTEGAIETTGTGTVRPVPTSGAAPPQ